MVISYSIFNDSSHLWFDFACSIFLGDDQQSHSCVDVFLLYAVCFWPTHAKISLVEKIYDISSAGKYPGQYSTNEVKLNSKCKFNEKIKHFVCIIFPSIIYNFFQIQFVWIVVHTSIAWYLNCGFPNGYNIALIVYCFSHIILFSNFYHKSYIQKRDHHKVHTNGFHKVSNGIICNEKVLNGINGINHGKSD